MAVLYFHAILGHRRTVFFTITVDWGNRYESVYHSVCLEPMKSPILPHGCSWVLTRKQGTVTKSNTFSWHFVLWTSSHGILVWDSEISTYLWISPPSLLFLYLRIIFLSCSFSWCFLLNHVYGPGILFVSSGPGCLTFKRQENMPFPLLSVTPSCP